MVGGKGRKAGRFGSDCRGAALLVTNAGPRCAINLLSLECVHWARPVRRTRSACCGLCCDRGIVRGRRGRETGGAQRDGRRMSRVLLCCWLCAYGLGRVVETLSAEAAKSLGEVSSSTRELMGSKVEKLLYIAKKWHLN